MADLGRIILNIQDQNSKLLKRLTKLEKHTQDKIKHLTSCYESCGHFMTGKNNDSTHTFPYTTTHPDVINQGNNIQPECPDLRSKEEFQDFYESKHEILIESIPAIPQQCVNNEGIRDQSSLSKNQKKRARAKFNNEKNDSGKNTFQEKEINKRKMKLDHEQFNPISAQKITFDGLKFDNLPKDNRPNCVLKCDDVIFKLIEPCIQEQFGNNELNQEDYVKIAEEVTQFNQNKWFTCGWGVKARMLKDNFIKSKDKSKQTEESMRDYDKKVEEILVEWSKNKIK